MTPEPPATPRPGQLLVAIMNDRRDMAIARDQGWYRIPVSSAQKWLKDHWPPQWLAFYQTKVFGSEKYAINYYAKVLGVQKATRETLFPNEPPGNKSGRLYYKLLLGPLQTRPQPITSLRRRRLPTHPLRLIAQFPT